MKYGLKRRKPLRRSLIRPKERVGIVGGEYMFMHAGKTYVLSGKFVNDPVSPDGWRWVATRESNRVIRVLVCELAGERCEMRSSEQCWGWAKSWNGHPHHVRHKKMGGAFTDDRIWIEVDGERVRIRIWACPSCHQEHHGPLAWSKKNATSS
jgi:hypothetical protein